MGDVIDITDKQGGKQEEFGPAPGGFVSWEAYHRHLGCYKCTYAVKERLGKGPCCNDPTIDKDIDSLEGLFTLLGLLSKARRKTDA